MGSITIDGSNYNVDNLVEQTAAEDSRLYIDVDGNESFTNGVDEEIFLTKAELATLLHGMGIDPGDTEMIQLSDILESIDEVYSDSAGEAVERLEAIARQLRSIEREIAKINAGETTIAEDKRAEAIARLEEVKEALTREATELLEHASGMRMSDRMVQRFERVAERLGMMFTHDPQSASSSSGSDGARAAQNPNAGSGQQQGGGGARAAQNPQAVSGPPGGGFQAGWNYGNGGGFNFNAYANSVYMDQAIFDGWDSIGQNQANQQKMMMLFYYFATMAMSGDLGAMYRFMQFITYIISKDKALQNIHMASKLIEMENSSRAALDELLKAPTPDGQDQAASYEFTKIMERTKAHQSSIATSQKLIAQMMEEMAQVVETLTGATKNALDANGRILQRLTRG